MQKKEGTCQMSNYNNACTEVYTILDYLDENEYKKIPFKVIKAIESSRNLQYEYELDERLELRQQKMLKETKAILYNLFRDYLCTEKQREIIKRQQSEERQNKEIRKTKKYNPKDIFKGKITEQTTETIQQENTVDNAVSMVEYKERFFTRIINKIKNIFR